jgi:hypothetical protein
MYIWGVEVDFHTRLTFTIVGRGLNFMHRPHFPRDKILILLEREPGWAAELVGNFGEEKNLLHMLEYETRITQPVAYLLYRLR